MARKKNTAKVSFGTPVEELPDTRPGGKQGPARHWIEVAEHCKANPGVWHPVIIDTLTVRGHASAASSINAASRDSKSKTGKNTAFTEPGFRASHRKGLGLLVRYDAPAATPISRGRKAPAAHREAS